MLLLSAKYTLSKVRSSERTRKEQLLAVQERAFRKAFFTFVGDPPSPRLPAEFRKLLADNNQQAAVKLVEQHIVAFARIIPNVFIDVARKETAALASKAGFRKAAPKAQVSRSE